MTKILQGAEESKGIAATRLQQQQLQDQNSNWRKSCRINIAIGVAAAGSR